MLKEIVGGLFMVDFDRLMNSSADGLIQALISGWKLDEGQRWETSCVVVASCDDRQFGPGWFEVVRVIVS
jgi:hypothetical protein